MASGSDVKKSKKSADKEGKKRKKKSSAAGDDDDDKNTKAAMKNGGKNKTLLIVGAVLILLVILSRLGGSDSTQNDAPAAEGKAKANAQGGSDGESTPPPKKSKKKKKSEAGKDEEDEDESLEIGDVDFIESKYSSLGWTKTQGPLVTKRIPRECPIKRISQQVTTPFFIVNKKTKWKRRIFTCLRFNKQECSRHILEDFEARRWKFKPSKLPLENRLLSTFVLTDPLTLKKLEQSKPEVFNELYFRNEGSTYLNAVLGSEALDGSILDQFQSRAQFTQQFGCSYNALKIQLPQFRYDVSSECQKLEKQYSRRAKDSWLLSSFGEDGSPGVTSVMTTAAMQSKGFCSENGRLSSVKDSRKLASLIVPNPFKVEGKLFDVRGFVLVGSTMPMMVFFKQGYVRQSDGTILNSPFLFDNNAAAIGLDAFQDHLAKEKITGSHYVDTFLKSSMKQIGLFVFHAARTKLLRRKGSFQIFSVDYVIDSTFRVYLEKTSGTPDFDSVRGIDFGPMIADMHDLVQELHEVPVAFEGMIKGDKYGEWELIFSELRESCHKIVFNPCHEFIDFNDKDLVKSNRKVGKVQATAKRLENEQKRIVKKTEEKKKNTCREKKIPYPSTKCNKLLESMDQEQFEKLFKEHEQSFNPNEFRLPKSGEVFPHEMV